MAEVAPAAPVESQAKHILYCGVCTLPPEYCEFGGTAKKCEEWLKDHHPDAYQALYSEGLRPCLPVAAGDALSSNLSSLSVSARERAAKDAAKKEAKAAAAEARDAERKAASKVQIKRVERNKRKHVTVITGLDVYGLENKKLAKDLGKKFATGSSMTRSAAGTEEITVQGDVSEDVKEWLLEVYGKEIPEANIELIEDKKKKSSSST
ncbi:eIF1-like protein [Aspergillus heteromorphus CBS 117.55]|uniref:Translation machinery-associated protein 22 n=1 Tax=Aspergillus heteromorphus CBS 117.55 TaxID=1448321 RepID=A0A317V2C0_9EURO|nr:eIF1-like protein [Aspergillus heteromorphus CBS 117.55]PWY66350.1 eIF1-like protein [Aspergillus heteromorphus CBS 117.55]